MPCRRNQSTASYLRPLRWGLGVWVTVLTCATTVVVTQSHAATTPPTEEKTTLTPEWQAVAQAVTQWGAQAYPDAPAILLSDINNRIQPNACTSDLVVDTPFGQSSNVRVRCASPAWQLFVTTNFQATTTPQPAAANRDVKQEKPTPLWTTPQPAAANRGVKQEKPAPLWVVPSQHLTRGTRIVPGMLQLVPGNARVPSGSLITSLERTVGAELVRDAPAGKPLRRHDLRAAVLVKRGAMVKLSIGGNKGFEISVRVLAQENAHMGEQVKLKHPESGRIITGKVVGLNTVVAL